MKTTHAFKTADRQYFKHLLRYSWMQLFGALFFSTQVFAVINGDLITPAIYATDGPQRSVVGILIVARNSSGINVSNCGGTLISQTAVLTAAHCLRHLKDPATEVGLFVVAGANLAPNVQFEKRLSIDLHSVVLNPAYDVAKSETDQTNVDNDVAIVRLPQTLPATFHAAQLPGVDDELNSDPFTVMGYGLTHHTREVAIALTNGQKLSSGQLYSYQSHFSGIASSDNRLLVADQLVGAGLCDGDSGSGVLSKLDSGYKLIALANFALASLTPEQRALEDSKGDLKFFEKYPNVDLCVGKGVYLDLRPQVAWIKSIVSGS